MTEQIIYKNDSLSVSYDNALDEICVLDMISYEQNNIPYFTLEEIMENARKAHIMRNNLRLEGEEYE